MKLLIFSLVGSLFSEHCTSQLIKDPSYLLSGDTVTVAFLDSGVDSSLILPADFVLESLDYTGEGPLDFNGHGTEVLGIFIQTIERFEYSVKTFESNKKPLMRILNLKVIDKNGGTDELRILNALNTAIQKHSRVINLSLSMERPSNRYCKLCRAVRQIGRRGSSIIVMATGNWGLDLSSETDLHYCPQQYFKVNVEKDDSHEEIFEDIVYLANGGHLEKATRLLLQVVYDGPSKKMSAKLSRVSAIIFWLTQAKSSLNAGHYDQTVQLCETAER